MMEQRDRTRILLSSKEAAEWFIRLKDMPPSRVAHREYLNWLKASPSHMAEALRIGRMYGLLRYSQPLPGDARQEASNVVEMLVPGPAGGRHDAGAAPSKRLAVPVPRRRWKWLRRALVAAPTLMPAGRPEQVRAESAEDATSESQR